MRTGQNGAYDSYGKLDYDNKEILRYYGNFEQGNFRPTFTQLVASLCSKKSDGIVLTEQVKEYLTNNQFDISSPIRWRLNKEDRKKVTGSHENVIIKNRRGLYRKEITPVFITYDFRTPSVNLCGAVRRRLFVKEAIQALSERFMLCMKNQ